ncbi:MAG: 23S rRNA (uridine(2552)-2'-O)-methyltransferase RlmE [Gammaproteobacteria bacterium]|nr:23S rRNA (uridine(2552)-2'-O)-methyltransferase RlmE [Gammaproteobacteria bacterium]
MAKSKSSQRWMKEHFDDEYVLRAQREGYRSRAVYKLMELDEKYRLLKPGHSVVDLGAAPGGWSQYAAQRVGEPGKVLATDILPMNGLAGVQFVLGDFREAEVLDTILRALGGNKADAVLSDMAPNMSGTDAVDIPRAMYLVELAHDTACRVLRPGGLFLSKMFQGEGSEQFLVDLRQHFTAVNVRKPRASRPRSREVYVLATGFKP